MIKSKDLRRAQQLVDRFARGEHVIRTLNEINKGEMVSFPDDVFRYVDREAAAKGLLSLIIEAQAADRKELEELGIELE